VEDFKVLTKTPTRKEGRVRQLSVALAVVIIVIGMLTLTTDTGSQDNFLISGFTALIFLPSLIAGIRLHRDRWAIFVCNVFMLGSLLLSVEIAPLFLMILPGVGLTWGATMIWSLSARLELAGAT
jgi:hypothetical protein